MGWTILASTGYGSLTSGKGRGGGERGSGKYRRLQRSPTASRRDKPTDAASVLLAHELLLGFWLLRVARDGQKIMTAQRHENVIAVSSRTRVSPRNAVLSRRQWSPTGNPCMSTWIFDCRPPGIVIMLFPARPASLGRAVLRLTDVAMG